MFDNLFSKEELQIVPLLANGDIEGLKKYGKVEVKGLKIIFESHNGELKLEKKIEEKNKFS